MRTKYLSEVFAYIIFNVIYVINDNCIIFAFLADILLISRELFYTKILKNKPEKVNKERERERN